MRKRALLKKLTALALSSTMILSIVGTTVHAEENAVEPIEVSSELQVDASDVSNENVIPEVKKVDVNKNADNELTDSSLEEKIVNVSDETILLAKNEGGLFKDFSVIEDSKHSAVRYTISLMVVDNPTSTPSTLDISFRSKAGNGVVGGTFEYDQANNKYVGSVILDLNYENGEYYIFTIGDRVYMGSLDGTPIFTHEKEYPIMMDFKNYSDNGMVTENIYKVINTPKFTLKEIGVSLPEFSYKIPGVEYLGWQLVDGTIIDENTEFTSEDFIGRPVSIVPHTNKMILPVKYSYFNAANDSVEKYVNVLVDSLDKDVVNQALSNNIPNDANTELGTVKLKYANNLLDKSTNSYYVTVRWIEQTCEVLYEEGIFVNVFAGYVGKDGIINSECITSTPVKVGPDDKIDDIAKQYMQNTPYNEEKGYPGIHFDKWASYNIRTNNDIYLVPSFKENYVVYAVSDPNSSVEGPEGYTTFVDIFEKNQTFKFKTEFPGFENVKININATEEQIDKIIKNSGVQIIYCTGTPVDPVEPPVDPVEPPVDPVEPPVDPEAGKNELAPEDIQVEVDKVTEAKENEKVLVDMGTATVVPKEILEAAKDKDVTVEFNMGDYSWKVKGTDITSTDLAKIDLRVDLVEDVIPAEDVKKLAGDKPVQQISLKHNGEFGFKAVLKINVGSQYAGKIGNLYYYDNNGKMNFIDGAKVSKEGFVEVKFTHASDYVMVFDNESANQNNNPSDSQTGNKTDDTSKKGTAAPKTGDDFSVLPYVSLMMACLMIVAVLSVKKKNNK